jgi:hypothetical protein
MLALRSLSLVLSVLGCFSVYADDETTPPDGPIVVLDDTEVRGLQCVGYFSVWSHLGIPKDSLLLERERYFVSVPLADIEGLRLTCWSGNVQLGAPRVAEGRYRRGENTYDLKGSTMPHALLSGWTQTRAGGKWRFIELTNPGVRKNMHTYLKKEVVRAEDDVRVLAKVVLRNDKTLTLRKPAIGWSFSEPGQRIAVELNDAVYTPQGTRLDSFRLDSVSRIGWSQGASGGHLEFIKRSGETKRLWMMGEERYRFVTGEGDEGQLYILLGDLNSIEFENEPRR